MTAAMIAALERGIITCPCDHEMLSRTTHPVMTDA
jgi:hypothetical protein